MKLNGIPYYGTRLLVVKGVHFAFRPKKPYRKKTVTTGGRENSEEGVSCWEGPGWGTVKEKWITTKQ